MDTVARKAMLNAEKTAIGPGEKYPITVQKRAQAAVLATTAKDRLEACNVSDLAAYYLVIFFSLTISLVMQKFSLEELVQARKKQVEKALATVEFAKSKRKKYYKTKFERALERAAQQAAVVSCPPAPTPSAASASSSDDKLEKVKTLKKIQL